MGKETDACNLVSLWGQCLPFKCFQLSHNQEGWRKETEMSFVLMFSIFIENMQLWFNLTGSITYPEKLED